MAIHMYRAHSIPLARPLNDPILLAKMERRLGLR